MFGTWSGVSFPLNAADYTDSFTPADPLLTKLIGLFRAAILAELSEVWAKVVLTLPAGHPLRGTTPVQDTLELEPDHQFMQQRKATFPLLALHRTDTRLFTPVSTDSTQRAQPWELHWILGAFDIGIARKLLGACLLVEGIVGLTVSQGYHEAFESGALQFTSGTVRLEKSQGPGQARYGGDENSGATYWAIVMTLNTIEFSSDTGEDGETGDPPLDGSSYDVGLGSDEGVLPSAVLGDTDSIMY